MVCCPCLCSGTQLHWIYVGVGSQPYRSWLSMSFRDEFDAVSSEKLLQFKEQLVESPRLERVKLVLFSKELVVIFCGLKDE